MKKVIMIHGWGGNNADGWFLPLKKELEKENFIVINPNMPDTLNPKIDQWVNEITKVSGEVNEDTFFIGHSIGCQSILRFLEKQNKQVGGVILIAAWLRLTDKTWDEKYTREIAKPWIENPMDFNKIRNNCKKFLVILSKDDPYVPIEDSKLFKKNLNAEIIIIDKRQHIEELKKEEMKKIISFIKNNTNNG